MVEADKVFAWSQETRAEMESLEYDLMMGKIGPKEYLKCLEDRIDTLRSNG